MTSPASTRRAADIRKHILNDEHDIIDALAKLRHLCDSRSLDFAALDRIAYQHYLKEKAP